MLGIFFLNLFNTNIYNLTLCMSSEYKAMKILWDFYNYFVTKCKIKKTCYNEIDNTSILKINEEKSVWLSISELKMKMSLECVIFIYSFLVK